jgi:hypothetical protein
MRACAEQLIAAGACGGTWEAMRNERDGVILVERRAGLAVQTREHHQFDQHAALGCAPF